MTTRAQLALEQGYLRINKMTFTLDLPAEIPAEAWEGVNQEYQAISGELLNLGYEWKKEV